MRRAVLVLVLTLLACGLVGASARWLERRWFGDPQRYRGPPGTLLVIVSPGCVGCRHTLANLVRLTRRAPHLGAGVLAVARADPAASAALAGRLDAPFPIVAASESSLGAALSGRAVPILRAFDSGGALVAERFGPRDIRSDSLFLARWIPRLQPGVEARPAR